MLVHRQSEHKFEAVELPVDIEFHSQKVPEELVLMHRQSQLKFEAVELPVAIEFQSQKVPAELVLMHRQLQLKFGDAESAGPKAWHPRAIGLRPQMSWAQMQTHTCVADVCSTWQMSPDADYVLDPGPTQTGLFCQTLARLRTGPQTHKLTCPTCRAEPRLPVTYCRRALPSAPTVSLSALNFGTRLALPQNAARTRSA